MENKDFKQTCIMNNVYNKSDTRYNKLIWNNIDTPDEELLKSINSKIFDPYHAKINLINNLLYSNEPLPINDKTDIVKFFSILAPLNNEYNFGSYNWEHITYDKLLIFQNSILKSNYNQYVYTKYINPIRNVLKLSKFKVNFFQFTNKRFKKTVDLIFVIELL